MIKFALFSPSILAAILAVTDGDTPSAVWWAPLVNAGGIGVVLAWFMFRNEPRLRAIEASIDRASRTVLLLILSVKGVTNEAREVAQGLVSEIDTAANAREKK